MVAVSRSGARLTQRLRAMRFRAGDVIVLQGDLDALPETLAELGCLPLASRGVSLGTGRNVWLPAAVLAAAMLLVVAPAGAGERGLLRRRGGAPAAVGC